MRVELFNAQQGTEAMREIWPQVSEQLKAGKRLTVEIKEWTKSREQEKHYHAIIRHIAREAEHMGAKWGEGDWKRFLVDQFARDNPKQGEAGRIVPSLDGSGIVQLGEQTSHFTITRASEFISWLEAWATDKGIRIE
jgi:hypothetical protein